MLYSVFIDLVLIAIKGTPINWQIRCLSERSKIFTHVITLSVPCYFLGLTIAIHSLMVSQNITWLVSKNFRINVLAWFAANQNIVLLLLFSVNFIGYLFPIEFSFVSWFRHLPPCSLRNLRISPLI